MAIFSRLRWGAVVLFGVLATAQTGCYKSTFVNDAVTPATNAEGEVEEQSDKTFYFLWGLAGEGEVDLRRLCPHDVAEFTFKATAVDVIISTVTLGIVSPRTVEATCGRARTAPAAAPVATARAPGGAP